MHAVILAAGAGRRMGHGHKGLVDIGGTTPLDRLMRQLDTAGATQIVVATGHLAYDVERHLRRSHPEVLLRFVRNPNFATTNNAASLRLALEEVHPNDDVLIVECDLVLDDGILDDLVAASTPDVALALPWRPGLCGSVMDVVEGRVVAIRAAGGRSDRHERKTGNVWRFSSSLVREVLRPALAGGHDNAFYEAVLATVPGLADLSIAVHEVDPSRVVEIDDPIDLRRARFRFAPAQRVATLDRAQGGLWGLDVLDFGFMTNCRFPTPAVLDGLREGLPDVLSSYGSAQAVLDEKVAVLLGCPPSRVLALGGASQAYPPLARQWDGRRVAIPSPTFGEYARAFPDAAYYADTPGFARDEIERLARRVDLLVVVTPNNPTGTALETGWLHGLAARHRKTTFLVDESFAPFVAAPSLRHRLEEDPLPNVIVIASLGKALGAPGARLGYLYATDREPLDEVAAQLPIWGVGSQAEHLVELAIGAREDLEASLVATREDRDAFRRELLAVPGIVDVLPGAGNFLLIELQSPTLAARLRRALLEDDAIAVKDVSARFTDADVGRLRVGVRLPAENARLVAALEARLAPAGVSP